MNTLRCSAMALGLLLVGAAHAVPITWRTTGLITESAPEYFFPWQVTAGDSIHFDYTFDNETACSTCESDRAVYNSVLTRLDISIGSTTFTMPLQSSSLYLANDAAIPAGYLDAFTLNFGGVDPTTGINFYGGLYLQNVFAQTPASPIDTVALAALTLPPDPLAFPWSPDSSANFFSFNASLDRGYNGFSGQLISSSSHAVPEPSSLGLMLLGGAALLLARKRGSALQVG